MFFFIVLAPGLVEMSAKLKKIEFAGKVKTDQKLKVKEIWLVSLVFL